MTYINYVLSMCNQRVGKQRNKQKENKNKKIFTGHIVSFCQAGLQKSGENTAIIHI